MPIVIRASRRSRQLRLRAPFRHTCIDISDCGRWHQTHWSIQSQEKADDDPETVREELRDLLFSQIRKYYDRQVFHNNDTNIDYYSCNSVLALNSLFGLFSHSQWKAP